MNKIQVPLYSKLDDFCTNWEEVVPESKVKEVKEILKFFYEKYDIPFKDIGPALEIKFGELTVTDRKYHIVYSIRYDNVNYVNIFLEENYYQAWSFWDDVKELRCSDFNKFKTELNEVLNDYQDWYNGLNKTKGVKCQLQSIINIILCKIGLRKSVTQK